MIVMRTKIFRKINTGLHGLKLTAKTGKVLFRNRAFLFLKNGDAPKIIKLKTEILKSGLSEKAKRRLVTRLDSLLEKHIRAAKEQTGLLTEEDVQNLIRESEDHE